jgi:hypothetical protein
MKNSENTFINQIIYLIVEAKIPALRDKLPYRPTLNLHQKTNPEKIRGSLLCGGRLWVGAEERFIKFGQPLYLIKSMRLTSVKAPLTKR